MIKRKENRSEKEKCNVKYEKRNIKNGELTGDRRSTNKIQIKHRKEQKQNRENNKIEGKKREQKYYRILTKRGKCLKKTVVREKQITNKYQIVSSKKMKNNRKRTD